MRLMTRRALVSVLGLAVSLGGLSAPAYAGEDKGMCNEDHSRGEIPNGFPLDGCFDGKTLWLKNGTEFPLVLTFTSNDMDQPQRYTRGGAGPSSALLSFVRPAGFGRTPVINAPDSRSGLIPPGYYVQADIGTGEVRVRLAVADASIQKTYVITKAIYDFLPLDPAVEVIKAIGELVRELADVGDQHVKCLDRNNAWGDIGCTALLGRNVSFAVGRAAVSGLGGGLVKAVVSLFGTATWADAAAGDLTKLQNGKNEFTIAASKPPAQPPKQNIGSNSGNSGDSQGGGNTGGGSTGGGSNPPPPAMATVQNMHLAGANQLAEDSTPAYLSTSMQPFCSNRGCKIGGTEMWSGDTLKAIAGTPAR